MVLDLSEYQNSIYHNPQCYDDQYWWKKNDIEFWKNIYKKSHANKILELGCGTGRLGLPLIRDGANYTGLEISKEFCKYAKQKISAYGFNCNIINKDFRNFNIDKKYDIIFIGFNTFLHLLNDSDAMHFLTSVKQHMNNKTLFYIDIFVPNPEFLYKRNKRMKNFEYVDSKTNETIYVDEICQYDNTTEVMKVKWIYYSKNKTEEEREFTMRMYFPDTMNRLLVDSGLTITNLWGDYYQSEFNELSELQIYECQL